MCRRTKTKYFLVVHFSHNFRNWLNKQLRQRGAQEEKLILLERRTDPYFSGENEIFFFYLSSVWSSHQHSFSSHRIKTLRIPVIIIKMRHGFLFSYCVNPAGKKMWRGRKINGEKRTFFPLNKSNQISFRSTRFLFPFLETHSHFSAWPLLLFTTALARLLV